MDDNNESDRAEVGSGSRSIGVTFSPAVEMAFERALAAAKERTAATLSTEDVLIELLDEETTSELLSSARIDVDALRTELAQHQAATSNEAPDGTQPRSDEPLQNAMRRAVIKALASNEKGTSGADIVVAILVENESYAAEILRRFGLTITFAEAAAVERYLQRSKEQARLLAEVQQKARAQRQLTAGKVHKAQGVRPPPSPASPTSAIVLSGCAAT